MSNHKNSRTTVYNRKVIVKCVINENARPADVANDFGISAQTVHKGFRLYRDEGSAGFENRQT